MKTILKYKILLLIFLFLSIGKIFSQEAHNLDKYWYYRERLKKQFMVSSPNDQPGTNLPADNRHAAIEESQYILNNYITWGDGTIYLSNYISVLATEYRLLKDYSQDVTSTLQELSNAMKAFDRLDYTAETYFTNNGTAGQANQNGFFIRNDVNESTKAVFNYPESHLLDDDGDMMMITDIASEFKNGVNPLDAEESMDQCWHMLLSLAMVTKLVNDNYPDANGNFIVANFKDWAQQQAYRIVSYMHHHNAYGGWNIINPVTGNYVSRGSDISYESIVTGYCWAFAEAGNTITEQRWGSLHYEESTDANHITQFGSLFTWGAILYGIDDFNFRALGTIIGSGFLDYILQSVINCVFI